MIAGASDQEVTEQTQVSDAEIDVLIRAESERIGLPYKVFKARMMAASRWRSASRSDRAIFSPTTDPMLPPMKEKSMRDTETGMRPIWARPSCSATRNHWPVRWPRWSISRAGCWST